MKLADLLPSARRRARVEKSDEEENAEDGTEATDVEDEEDDVESSEVESGGDGDEEDAAADVEDDEEEESTASARADERSRWQQVLASDQTKGRVDTAVTLLSSSDLPASVIITTLATVPQRKESANGFRKAMADQGNPNVSANGGASKGEEPTEDELVAARVRAVRSGSRSGRS